jgi:20S proteasome subunit beta 3
MAGTGQEYAMGICEGIWKPDMEPSELFEATAQALLAALGRDAASGYGALIYTITKDNVNIKSIRTRMD